MLDIRLVYTPPSSYLIGYVVVVIVVERVKLFGS